MMSQKPNLFPAFRYHNAPAALDWLNKAFGFEKQLTVPLPDGGIAHAQMVLGSGTIMLGTFQPEANNPMSQFKQGTYVYVEDVDEHYRVAKSAGAEIIRELQDTNHGSREYTARDPEGFVWSFGNYQPQPNDP